VFEGDSMSKQKIITALRDCLLAVLIIVIASAIRAMFFAGLGRDSAYLTYYPAVVLAALFGGISAGLLATVLSFFLAFFWIQRGFMSYEETLAMAVFLLTCIIISMIVERLRRANAKLQVEVTERRQADAEVKSLSNFPDENPDPVLRLNGQGIILYANHAGQAVLEAWKAAVGQAAPAFLLAKIAKAFETRSRQSIELSVGGRVFSFTIAPILDAGYVNLYGSDITERKQAEEAAQFLASIVDSTDDAIIGKSLDGIILSWNPGAEKLYGYPAQEAIGKPISIIALPGKPDEMQEILGKVSKGEKIEYYETERLTRDGKRIDVSLTVFPVRDRDGRIVAASMIGRDITERRQAENAIRKGQALLNETQMISKIGGWEYDMAAKRVYWTDEVYRIYGVTKEYDPGNPRQDIEFYLAGDQRKMDEAFRRAVEEGIPYDLELQLMNAAGEKLWVHTIGRAENKEGKVARVSGYIMDIPSASRLKTKLPDVIVNYPFFTK